jgi:hypothetical protein
VPGTQDLVFVLVVLGIHTLILHDAIVAALCTALA